MVMKHVGGKKERTGGRIGGWWFCQTSGRAGKRTGRLRNGQAEGGKEGGMDMRGEEPVDHASEFSQRELI